MKKVLVLLVVLLSGCAAPSGPQTLIADELVASGLVADTIITAKLGLRESQEVAEAIRYFQFFAASVRSFESISETALAYNELHLQYIKVYMIVSAHWDEYPEAKQLELAYYEQEANLYAASVRELLAAKQQREALSQTYQFGGLILKLVGVL